MTLVLQDLFTDRIVRISHVTSFAGNDMGYRVYTEFNGSRDMQTYNMHMVVSAETEDRK